jgi:hypothetical protein
LTNLFTFHGNFEASAYLAPRFLKAFGSPRVLSSPLIHSELWKQSLRSS